MDAHAVGFGVFELAPEELVGLQVVEIIRQADNGHNEAFSARRVLRLCTLDLFSHAVCPFFA